MMHGAHVPSPNIVPMLVQTLEYRVLGKLSG